ncbi:hypothetical protein N7493_010389 [Penicillium malachiteum]|uniref:Uncharacterized protein n=1 Tax=Penicillium malachiteum TaxID=1324776 RepID=A0AAD6MRG0_9EURO|nr:hypothetical protein N7493_010389 [Penicillium malachiteum]
MFPTSSIEDPPLEGAAPPAAPAGPASAPAASAGPTAITNVATTAAAAAPPPAPGPIAAAPAAIALAAVGPPHTWPAPARSVVGMSPRNDVRQCTRCKHWKKQWQFTHEVHATGTKQCEDCRRRARLIANRNREQREHEREERYRQQAEMHLQRIRESSGL